MIGRDRKTEPGTPRDHIVYRRVSIAQALAASGTNRARQQKFRLRPSLSQPWDAFNPPARPRSAPLASRSGGWGTVNPIIVE